jgi:hypothetical protein
MYNLIFKVNKLIRNAGLGKKYFIQQFDQQEYMHGGVTCVDAEKVLLKLGFKPISFPHHHNFSLSAKMGRLFFLLKMIVSAKRRSTVAFLFPVYARMNWLLLRILRLKGVKLVCIIADIEGMRDSDEDLLKTETRQLRQCRYFIVHNDKMKSLISQIVPGSTCQPLFFFDFLTDPLPIQRTKTNTIVFAGNLEKSKFLLQLDQVNSPIQFNVYGPGIPEKIIGYTNVQYGGIHKPYAMPGIVQGSFGLIWDGNSIESCTGGYGTYLHYNSQHKLSLYILSSLPVIVWEEAATAELVKEYKIGFTINSLHEIAGKINSLSDDEYRQMQINMRPLAEKISKGECLGVAITQLMG